MSIKQKHHIFFHRETGDSPLHLMDFGVADGHVPMPKRAAGQGKSRRIGRVPGVPVGGRSWGADLVVNHHGDLDPPLQDTSIYIIDINILYNIYIYMYICSNISYVMFT